MCELDGASANFTGLVIGCIETKFCKKIIKICVGIAICFEKKIKKKGHGKKLVGKLSPRSTQCTTVLKAQIFVKKSVKHGRPILPTILKEKIEIENGSKECIV